MLEQLSSTGDSCLQNRNQLKFGWIGSTQNFLHLPPALAEPLLKLATLVEPTSKTDEPCVYRRHQVR